MRLFRVALAPHEADRMDFARRLPQTDETDKQTGFMRWLALFFIERGRYKITVKGYAELIPLEVRQDTYFGEQDSARERGTKKEVVRPLTRKEIMEVVAGRVGKMLSEGKAEELYDKDYIDRPAHFDWTDKEVRITVVRKLIEILEKRPTEISEKRDFYGNGLRGMLPHYENQYYYLALAEAGYAYSYDELKEHTKSGEFGTEKIYPWEMPSVPRGFYKRPGTVKSAFRWLVWKLGKEPMDIAQEDLAGNGLRGLMTEMKNSYYLILVEAGYAYSEAEILEHAKNGNFGTEKIYPWEDHNLRVYGKEGVRTAAVKWVVWKLGKEPRNITGEDFDNLKLTWLLARYYNNSPYKALLEVGLVSQSDEIYMRKSGPKN